MVIEQDGVKRELDTSKPFSLCLGRDEARMLIDRLKEKAEDGAGYGWITVWPLIHDARTTNTKPIPWTDTESTIGRSVHLRSA